MNFSLELLTNAADRAQCGTHRRRLLHHLGMKQSSHLPTHPSSSSSCFACNSCTGNKRTLFKKGAEVRGRLGGCPSVLRGGVTAAPPSLPSRSSGAHANPGPRAEPFAWRNVTQMHFYLCLCSGTVSKLAVQKERNKNREKPPSLPTATLRSGRCRISRGDL